MEHLVERARAYATQAHARIDQRRKYSGQPYDVHLKSVAALVASVSDDPQMLAAAWPPPGCTTRWRTRPPRARTSSASSGPAWPNW